MLLQVSFFVGRLGIRSAALFNYQLVQSCQAHSSFAVNLFVKTFRSRLLSRRGNKRNTVAFGGKPFKKLSSKVCRFLPVLIPFYLSIQNGHDKRRARFAWRKVRDSNPRKLFASTVFKTAAFDRSANLPREVYSTINRKKTQPFLPFLPVFCPLKNFRHFFRIIY